MPNPINIREATATDYAAIADVMFDAVRNGKSKYTEAQRSAWVPQPRSGVEWNNRLASQTILLALRDGQIVGFMSLGVHGYIDFAFIRPSAQGTGVFRQLYESIEQLAREKKEIRLWVHASLMAQPAFSAMGFAITKTETVEIGDQALQRFEMEKQLTLIGKEMSTAHLQYNSVDEWMVGENVPEVFAMGPDPILRDKYIREFGELRRHLYVKHVATLSQADQQSIRDGRHPSQNHDLADQAQRYCEQLKSHLESLGLNVDAVQLGFYHMNRIVLSVDTPEQLDRSRLRQLPWLFEGFEIKYESTAPKNASDT